MSTFPPLPTIEGDVEIQMDVYIHPAASSSMTNHSEEHGNAARLAALGQSTFEFAVTHALFRHNPQFSAAEIKARREDAMSDDSITRILGNYQLREKVRAPADINVYSPEEGRRLWTTFLGALTVRNGVKDVQNFVGHLVIETYEDYVPPQGPQPTYVGQPTVIKPQPPRTQPPPIPRGASSVPPENVTLALMNQTAQQYGMPIEYKAEPSGPDHNKIWTVQCFVNNMPVGSGTGKSQKLAKEIAARQAWVVLGWNQGTQ